MIDFKTLRVWEAFHKITLRIYSITKQFSHEEVYGLTAQIRRASASVPTNIAEGCGRYSDAELLRFLVIAMGSACELEYQLLLSKDLSYINTNDYENMMEELITAKKMLNAFIQKVGERKSKH